MAICGHRCRCPGKPISSVVPAEIPQLTRNQFLVHALLSIHPTYRATTNPSRFLPSSASLQHWAPGKAPPDSAVPAISSDDKIPTPDQLRYDVLGDRRRANAVFVVLGASRFVHANRVAGRLTF
jgi:alpha 1,2-mannosyltransferase